MYQISALMMLIASLGTSGLDTEIDSLKYRSNAAVRAVWKAQWGTSLVSKAAYQGENVLRVETPADQSKPTQRLTLDRSLKKNLSSPNQFRIEIKLLSPASGERLSLYFHSGNGWYVGSARVDSDDWTVLSFAKKDFTIEDQPAGWDKIDGIRLSLWKGSNERPSFLLRNLSAHSSLVAIIVPDEQNEQTKTSFQVADNFESFLASVNVPLDRVTESSLQAGGLGKRKLAILPHNPTLDAQACEVLNRFMDKGGKLFICYRIPAAIATHLGIKQGTYYRPEKMNQNSLQFILKRIALMVCLKWSNRIPGISQRESRWGTTLMQ